MARPAWRGGLSQKSLPESVEHGVAFLARIVRFLVWLIFFAWIAWLVRRLVGAADKGAGTRVPRPAPPKAPLQLYRDPWCGTHVSPEISHTLEEAGQVLHFCSAECRERYRAAQRRAVSG